MNVQGPMLPGFVSLEEVLGDDVHWPDTTLISSLDLHVSVGIADLPRRVVLLPTSTTPEPIMTLADLREGAQRVAEGEALMRLRYADVPGAEPVLEPRAFVTARIP